VESLVPLAAENVLDGPAETVLAAATIVAVAGMGAGLLALLRAPERRAVRSGLTPALVMLTGGAAITFAAWLGYAIRCGGGTCHPGAGGGFLGLDRWWLQHDSWQWGTELLLAALGLAAAAVAFWLAARRSRRARPALWLARLVYLSWFLLILATAVYGVVNG
jgi:hypothetical protein